MPPARPCCFPPPRSRVARRPGAAALDLRGLVEFGFGRLQRAGRVAARGADLVHDAVAQDRVARRHGDAESGERYLLDTASSGLRKRFAAASARRAARADRPRETEIRAVHLEPAQRLRALRERIGNARGHAREQREARDAQRRGVREREEVARDDDGVVHSPRQGTSHDCQGRRSVPQVGQRWRVLLAVSPIPRGGCPSAGAADLLSIDLLAAHTWPPRRHTLPRDGGFQ